MNVACQARDITLHMYRIADDVPLPSAVKSINAMAAQFQNGAPFIRVFMIAGHVSTSLPVHVPYRIASLQ